MLKIVLPVIFGILVLGVLGSQDVFADSVTLFPTFVDSFSVTAQQTLPTGVAFSSDGTKMFVVGTIGGDINEYTLSTAFDVSTALFVDSISVAGQETIPTGVAFSSDGTKMFVVGTIGDDVNEYQISSIMFCNPPLSGDWVIDTICTMTSSATVNGNVIVSNGVVLTIPNGMTLDINFATKNLTVQDGGGVLIKSGGTIT